MTNKKFDIKRFQALALEARKEILKITARAKCGHPGGSLSAVEILISLYGYALRYDPHNPHSEGRDYLIISKGHASPVVYVVLSQFGFFPKEELIGYRTFGSRLQGHVHKKVPGVEFNTGSLGHGLSVANGIAYGIKKLNKENRVYCLLGDGELQEGSVWEAAMTASHHKLDRICAIIDYNKVQENGLLAEIKSIEPLAQKWSSFGWEVAEIDGHNFNALKTALDKFETNKEKPFVIIANTVKGKGVSFMEGDKNWHGKAPNEEQLAKALAELK